MGEAARVLGSMPGFEDWVGFIAAQSAAEAGDLDATERLLSQSGPDLAHDWGWRARTRALGRAGYLAVGAGVATFSATSTSGVVSSSAWQTAGDLRLATADTANAMNAYRRAIDAEPRSDAALAAAEVIVKLPSGAPELHLQAARALLAHGRLQRAGHELDRQPAIESTVGSALELQVALGRALLASHRYADVEARMARLPGPDAALLHARAIYRQRRHAQALTALEDLCRRFPGTEAAAEAYFILADLEHDRGELQRARLLYEEAIAAAPASVHAYEAAVRLAGEATTWADRLGATLRLERVMPAASGWQAQRLAYWAGRGFIELRREDRSRELLETVLQGQANSLYAFRAADLLDRPWLTVLSSSPGTRDGAAREARGGLNRIEALRSLGLTASAAYESDRLVRHLSTHEGGLYALAELYHERGRILDGIRLGRAIQAAEGNWNPRLLRLVYPFPFQAEIEAAAARRGVDPFLVAAIIRQESTFNRHARSPAGAVGLMQLKSTTARTVARRAGFSAARATRLTDPGVNLALGILHLRDPLDRFDGQLPEALAAYNAGSSRVGPWLDFPERADPDLFAERIPFPETREYVRVVRENALIYRVLYEQGQPIEGL